MTTKRLPVLFLDDVVLLPGMVVPIALDEAAQAAIDAAQTSSDGELLVAPRLDDRYAGVRRRRVDRAGRPPARRSPAAVLRTGERARIGTGVTGPGAALWVEAEPVDEAARHRPTSASWPRSTSASSSPILQRREAWQVIDTVQRDRPTRRALADTAGCAPYLTDEQKRAAAGDPRRRRSGWSC